MGPCVPLSFESKVHGDIYRLFEFAAPNEIVSVGKRLELFRLRLFEHWLRSRALRI